MKRTRHSKEFKIQVIKEAMETGNTSVVARRYELNAQYGDKAGSRVQRRQVW